MKIPSFHDGFFDGIWIGPNKRVQFFLRTANQMSFILSLEGVHALTLTEIKQGNIILDLVFRSPQEMNHSDMKELYDLGDNTPQAMTLLKTATERELQLLEINPSYGAKGLVLFQTWDLSQRAGQS